MALALIISAGIIATLLLYFGSQINSKEHFMMQILAYSFAIILFIIIAKATLDSETTCESVINQTVQNSTIANITTTEYTYGTHCYSNSGSTSATTLYRVALGFFVLYLAYLIIYTFYWLLKRFSDWVKKFRR